MEALVGAVVLAWIVLVVLAFATAGLLRQLRDVQVALSRAQLAGGAGPVPAARELPASVMPRGSATHAVVLVVDDHCPMCAEVAPEFDRLAATTGPGEGELDLVVLGRTPAEKFAALEHARYVTDSAAYHRLDPGWRPAIVVLNSAGEVLAAEPAGSVDAVRSILADVTTTVNALRTTDVQAG